MSKRAALFLNLGSPDSTSVPDVRRYLREFLMDERVLNVPFLSRWFIVNLLILPTRPKNSAEAYEKIWTPEGSPLILTSRELQERVGEKVDIPIELGMRYGNPSTPDAVKACIEDGVDELFIVPLYPHYAMSSYETAVEWVHKNIQKLAPSIKTSVLPPFYDHPEYIDALCDVSRPYLESDYDLVLFSYHGIPEKHLRASDPTQNHCLACEDCCNTPSEAHKTCYRHQCFETVKHFVQRANVPAEKYKVSFQSRLGKDPWLKPYTDFVLEELPEQGVKKLLVMCPAFVADNLETLEEIAMTGKESFIAAGGESFQLIPALNTHPSWIQFLQNRINDWINQS